METIPSAEDSAPIPSNLMTLARELLQNETAKKIAKLMLGNPKAFSKSRIWNWISGKTDQTIPRPFFEGMALGLVHAQRPDVAAKYISIADLRKQKYGSEAWEGVPDSLIEHRFNDLSQTQLWAKKVVHLTHIKEESPSESLCSTLRFWHDVTPIGPDRTLPYMSLTEGGAEDLERMPFWKVIGDPDLVTAGYSGAVPGGESSIRTVRFSATIKEPASVGFRYSLRNVFRRCQAAESTRPLITHEFSSGQNIIPSVEAFVIVVAPKTFVSPRLDSLQAFSFAPVASYSPMQYIHDVILRSLADNSGEAQSFQRVVDLWKSSGRILDRAYVGEDTGFLPPEIAEHVAPFWPSFPNAGANERVLIGHFEIPNPLKFNAVFWKLPERTP